jgi:multiple sugar transport system ATP-binding protein
MTMGHRVAVLLDGVLQQVDSPRSLYDKPANAFVAGFIGSPAMNIRTVDLVDGGAKIGNVVLPLDRQQAAAAAEGGDGKVTVGFRPEDSDLVGAGDGGIEVVVDLVEELGSDAYVYATAGGAESERLIVRTGSRQTPSLGETVYVKPRVGAHHVFHAASGVRL